MRKFKLFFDFKKEEKWLDEMAAGGYEFVGKTFGYRFREAQPETANIKIDFRKFKSKLILKITKRFLKIQAGNISLVQRIQGFNILTKITNKRLKIFFQMWILRQVGIRDFQMCTYH